MEIRRARVRDFPAIQSLVDLLHLPGIADQPWLAPDETTAAIRDRRYWLALDGTTPLGTIRIDEHPRLLEIVNLAVAPAARGDGVGRALVAYAQRLAHHRRRDLHVGSFHEYGVREFYLRCGFTQQPRDGTIQGHPYYRFRWRPAALHPSRR